jgi:hypothetical protein
MFICVERQWGRTATAPALQMLPQLSLANCGCLAGALLGVAARQPSFSCIPSVASVGDPFRARPNRQTGRAFTHCRAAGSIPLRGVEDEPREIVSHRRPAFSFVKGVTICWC